MADAHESKIKQEDFTALLKGYSPAQKFSYERDVLSGRYQILTGQPLPEFNSPFAKAYAARDSEAPTSSLYALVHDNTVPLRQKNIRALKEFRHPHLVALLDDGVTDISTVSEARYVTILERPSGQPLAQLLSRGKNPLSEATLIPLLRQMVEVLLAFNDMGISHNRINLDTIYVGNNNLVIGECISEPSGFSQNPLFEPIDRLLTSVWAKPDIAIHADCYALAVVALHLTIGNQPFTGMNKDTLINELLVKGSYHALVVQWDITDTMEDFFRGLLNDTHRERWDPKVIDTWLSGKRFNLILPSLPRETSHGFEFMGKPYFSRKLIAHTLFLQWADARSVLFDNKLARWIDTNTHKSEVADAISRISINNAGDNARGERVNSELVARIIMVLDPSGPIRFKNLSVSAEGLGILLVQASLKDQQEDIQTIAQIIDNDFIGFWAEQQKVPTDYAFLVNRYQIIRTNLRTGGLGFGIERCLYDLNPTLSCQSPLVKKFCVTDLAELLTALDSVAPQKGALESCMDRHVAGFIASKLDISKEIMIHEFYGMPELSKNPRLVALKLLLLAQHKVGDPPLAGLVYWMSSQLFPLLDHIHKRSLRHTLQENLRDLASRGMLQAVAGIFLNAKIFKNDHVEFHTAVEDFSKRSVLIAENKNHVYLARHSRIAGRGIAQTVAYGVCLTTIYVTLRSYFHF